MSFIPASDVMQVTVVAENPPELAVNTWYCEKPDALSYGALSLAFETFYTAIAARRVVSYPVTEVLLAERSGGGWSQVFMSSVNIPGAGLGVLPPQIAYRTRLVGFATGGFRPPIGGPYLGPLTQDDLELDGTMGVAAQNQIAAEIINLDATIKVLTGNLGLVVFSEKGVNEGHQVLEILLDDKYDTQRRRRNDFSGPFTSYPVP